MKDRLKTFIDGVGSVLNIWPEDIMYPLGELLKEDRVGAKAIWQEWCRVGDDLYKGIAGVDFDERIVGNTSKVGATNRTFRRGSEFGGTYIRIRR